jgi:ABC-type metal ion transport system substrate-binding protein
VLAVNADAQSDPRFRALAAALTSGETRAFITAHYGGAIYSAE